MAGVSEGSPESDSNRRPLPYHGGSGLAAVCGCSRILARDCRFRRLGRTGVCGCYRVLCCPPVAHPALPGFAAVRASWVGTVSSNDWSQDASESSRVSQYEKSHLRPRGRFAPAHPSDRACRAGIWARCPSSVYGARRCAALRCSTSRRSRRRSALAERLETTVLPVAAHCASIVNCAIGDPVAGSAAATLSTPTAQPFPLLRSKNTLASGPVSKKPPEITTVPGGQLTNPEPIPPGTTVKGADVTV